jgi:hypothetical protein
VISSIGYAIEALEARHHRETFSCGVEALYRYLKQQAARKAVALSRTA